MSSSSHHHPHLNYQASPPINIPITTPQFSRGLAGNQYFAHRGFETVVMSGYTNPNSNPGSSYPHHPHAQQAQQSPSLPHQQQQSQSHNGVRGPSPSGGNGQGHISNSLSPHGHQGLPNQQSFQYDQVVQQQLQAYANGGHVEDIQQQQQRVQLPAPSPSSSNHGGEGKGHKGNRLRKACDSCSMRKVKCDESGPPCRACAALDIPCTFERQSKRRGPPNRHAEAIKKKARESLAAGFSSPSSPSNVAATLASFSTHAVLNAESICPFSTLVLLIDDFFTYIHPLCPFPHEPSFRAAFNNREDLKNPSFLALMASMVGVLVASFPRKPRLHLKAQHREHLFPNSMSLVERCHKVAVAARGPGYLDKELSVYDAATSYFLGLAGAYTFRWKQTRLYFGECLTIIRVLGAHKSNDASLAVGALPEAYGADSNSMQGVSEPVDYIRQEIGRRLFWVMFVGVISIQQLGASFGELLIPPPTTNNPYPPLPMEIDDEYIFVDHIESQPPGVLSKITGFNINVRIYKTVTPLSTMELAYGIDEVFDWNRQKRVLEECLRNVKQVLEVVPQELMLLPGSSSGDFQHSIFQYYPPNADYPGIRSNGGDGNQWPIEKTEERRRLQFEIQKANIHGSQLGTRSSFVDKYCNLFDAYEKVKSSSGESLQLGSPGVMAVGLDGMLPKQSITSHYDETNVAQERESIVKDLLKVLSCINQVNMEPNGGSFINKIRQIASTLIETPESRKGPMQVKSEEYLGRFLDVLMKLERISPGLRSESDNGDGVVDEEEELRNWADLREYQLRFAQAGGFMAET
ncbi:uncharacterized protein RSE6_11819 [Rhynchosporium secalis]|uniref:Zn(2)-C6 fungal-type domain-containing protein n=1 Tax=Rhynchosporium secalis TaxID=38038 RepID=A0A1E1MNW0_RHYSE|nr:uncharacterized protein RSE6_11819 [Rhynchosporium secalis]